MSLKKYIKLTTQMKMHTVWPKACVFRSTGTRGISMATTLILNCTFAHCRGQFFSDFFSILTHNFNTYYISNGANIKFLSFICFMSLISVILN